MKFRTTLNLEESLLQQAKLFAATHHQTLTSLMEQGLRLVLSRSKTTVPKNWKLTTVSGKGLQAGVDLEDSASLLDLMENNS